MENIINEREMGIGEIFSYGFSIFKEKFKTIAMIILIVYIPINILLEMVSSMIITENLFRTYSTLVDLLELLFGILATMSITYVVYGYIYGEDIKYYGALEKSFSRWGAGIGTGIIRGIILFILFLALIIPGIIFGIYYTFMAQAIILKDIGGKDALDYSRETVKGSWGKVFGLSVLSGIIGIIVSLPLLILPENFIINVLSSTIIDIFLAFIVVVMTVAFINLDIIKDKETL
ncbi:hypothetical protein [Dethiothermospora halolimnae]|uniref:hypothetical protein n=1 Tax=Dethiothermospora halolimnae TaxID=3114390 RepID=UPI003CCBFF05